LRNTVTDTYYHADRNSHCYSHGNCNRDGDSYTHSNTDADPKGYSYTKVYAAGPPSPHSAASAVNLRSQVISDQ
jgi:hypothetical protein